MDVEIMKVLVLSTAHLTLNVSRMLELGESGPNLDVSWDPVTYGFLVVVPPGQDGCARLRIPRCIRDAIKLAQDQKCRRILFDCDGPFVSELKTHDW